MTRLGALPLTVVTEGLRFPEGPVALDDGSVIVTEIEGGSVARIDQRGHCTTIDCGGGPNGAAFGPDGALYVGNDGGLAFTSQGDIRFPNALAGDYVGGAIQRVDLETGSVGAVFTEVEGRRIGSLNDIVFDASGYCYVVDTSNGCLYYSDPVSGTIRVAEEGLVAPNGMGLSPSGDRLYVSETYSGTIWTWAVTSPGSLTDKRLFHSSDGENGWDGLAVDGAGHVCVANLQRSGITVINSDGTVEGRLVTPLQDPFVTNICFGGDTAFVCSSGRGILYSATWPWPGLRLNFSR